MSSILILTIPQVGEKRTPRLAYFTDLAELVSKIDEPKSSTSLYECDDEEESGRTPHMWLFVAIMHKMWLQTYTYSK